MADRYMQRKQADVALGLDVFAMGEAADGILRPRDKVLVAASETTCPREKRALAELAQDIETLRERVRAAKNRMAARRRQAAETEA